MQCYREYMIPRLVMTNNYYCTFYFKIILLTICSKQTVSTFPDSMTSLLIPSHGRQNQKPAVHVNYIHMYVCICTIRIYVTLIYWDYITYICIYIQVSIYTHTVYSRIQYVILLIIQIQLLISIEKWKIKPYRFLVFISKISSWALFIYCKNKVQTNER